MFELNSLALAVLTGCAGYGLCRLTMKKEHRKSESRPTPPPGAAFIVKHGNRITYMHARSAETLAVDLETGRPMIPSEVHVIRTATPVKAKPLRRGPVDDGLNEYDSAPDPDDDAGEEEDGTEADYLREQAGEIRRQEGRPTRFDQLEAYGATRYDSKALRRAYSLAQHTATEPLGWDLEDTPTQHELASFCRNWAHAVEEKKFTQEEACAAIIDYITRLYGRCLTREHALAHLGDDASKLIDRLSSMSIAGAPAGHCPCSLHWNPRAAMIKRAGLMFVAAYRDPSVMAPSGFNVRAFQNLHWDSLTGKPLDVCCALANQLQGKSEAEACEVIMVFLRDFF